MLPPPARPPASAGIRDHFVQSVELKFNCFFLMPIIDTFPTRLREELESAYEEDLDEVRWLALQRVWVCAGIRSEKCATQRAWARRGLSMNLRAQLSVHACEADETSCATLDALH